jgi:hypothetical protein
MSKRHQYEIQYNKEVQKKSLMKMTKIVSRVDEPADLFIYSYDHYFKVEQWTHSLEIQV